MDMASALTIAGIACMATSAPLLVEPNLGIRIVGVATMLMGVVCVASTFVLIG